MRRRVLACVAALGTVAVLAGCTATRPASSPTPVRSAPPASGALTSDGYFPSPTQPTVAPARTEKDAIAAASATVRADQLTLFGVYGAVFPGSSMTGFETGTALAQTNLAINLVGDSDGADGVLGQADVWTTANGTASPATADGKHLAFGSVTLSGCLTKNWRLNNSHHPVKLPKFPASTAYAVAVVYEPAERVWLISRQTELTGAAAKAACEPAQS